MQYMEVNNLKKTFTSVLFTSIAIFLEFKNTIVNYTCKCFMKLTPGLMRLHMKSNTKGLSILIFLIQAAVMTVKEDEEVSL